MKKNKLGEKMEHKEGKIFQPHLKSICNRIYYGTIGEETKLRDANGNSLKIGDIVGIYGASGLYMGDSLVVKKEKTWPFVMGIRFLCKKNGEIEGVYKILLKESCEKVENGKTLLGIKYIKEMEKK